MKKRAAELITIFLGVALAFLAEDWREYRGDRDDESSVLRGLAADFEENRRELAERLEWQSRSVAQIAELDSLLGDATTGSSLEVPDTLLVASFLGATYDPVRGNVDAVLTAGRIEIIRDEDLAAALAQWPSDVMDAGEDQDDQRHFVNDQLIPYLLRNEVPIALLISTLPAWAQQAVPEVVRVGTTSLRVTEELRGLISFRLFMGGLALNELQSLQEREEEIRSMLPAHR